MSSDSNIQLTMPQGIQSSHKLLILTSFLEDTSKISFNFPKSNLGKRLSKLNSCETFQNFSCQVLDHKKEKETQLDSSNRDLLVIGEIEDVIQNQMDID